MFLSSTPTGSDEFEIMVWLGALGGAGPISSTGSPIATPTIGSTTFNLFKGPNGQMTVYSFVATSKMDTNYSGDLKAFFTYLIANQGLSANEYLLSIGAGTEPFTGSNAVLTVSSYSAAVVLGSAPAPVSSTKAATTVAATSTKAATTVVATTKASTTTTSAKATGSALPKYSQCGGQGYTGSTVCAAGSTCTANGIYYSQCL
jgi:xyloglucan-specific endo-beta-1,4-glucanase